MENTKDTNKEKLIQNLQHIIDAENMMYLCCTHISSLIKNGKVRNKFNSFAESAKANRDYLISHLVGLGADVSPPQDKCKFCSVKAESFSLLGALNLGLEITDIVVDLYGSLINLTDDEEDRKRFKQILRERNLERISLKNEKRFVSKKEEGVNFIDSYCIPEVIAKLWR